MGNISTDYVNDINIQEAIVHILDSNSDEPVLNAYTMELTEEIYIFLHKHIEKILKSEELKFATFNKKRNIVKEVIKDYLNGIDSDFIGLSKELANQLFLIMKKNLEIPSCDCIVVSIITNQGPMVGIIKMDYIKNFTHQVDFVGDKIGIGIVPHTAGLPSSGQKIEKAAFIKPIRDEQIVDIMLIDKQKSSNEEDYGANYFTNIFLDCSVVTDKRTETKTFIQASEKWTRRNIVDDAVKSEHIRSSIKTALEENDYINIHELSDELFGDEPNTKADFCEFIMGNGLDTEIGIDKVYAEKKLQKVKLKIDRDIDISISQDAYKDINRFEIQRNDDGSINMIIKNIDNYIEK